MDSSLSAGWWCVACVDVRLRVKRNDQAPRRPATAGGPGSVVELLRHERIAVVVGRSLQADDFALAL
jgi:hypothetical protein